MAIRLLAALALLPLMSLAGDSEFSILNLPKATVAQFFMVFGALCLLVLFAFLFEKARTRKTVLESNRAMRKIFEQRARATGLTDAEAERLWKMARMVRSSDAQMIFDVVSIFEQGVEKSVAPLIRNPGSHDERLDTESLIASIRRKLKFNHIDNEHPLVSTRNIGVGQIVMVFPGHSSLPILQQARVVANFEFHLRLQYDPSKEAPVRIARGDRLRLSFARQHDGWYDIDMTVAAADSIGWIELHHTMALNRRQLRQDVRIEAAFPLKFRLVRTPDASEKERLGAAPQTVKVSDISGGGLSFTTDSPLTPEDVLSLSFQLPDNVVSGVQAKILRISEQTDKEKDTTSYCHHMQYVNIDPVQKEKIIKYVFERMRKNNQWR